MSREDDRFTDPLQRAARDLGEPPDSRQVRPMSASRLNEENVKRGALYESKRTRKYNTTRLRFCLQDQR